MSWTELKSLPSIIGATYDIDLNCTVVSHCLHVTVLSFFEFCSMNYSQIIILQGNIVYMVTLALLSTCTYVTVMCRFFFLLSRKYLLMIACQWFTYCRRIFPWFLNCDIFPVFLTSVVMIASIILSSKGTMEIEPAIWLTFLHWKVIPTSAHVRSINMWQLQSFTEMIFENEL